MNIKEYLKHRIEEQLKRKTIWLVTNDGHCMSIYDYCIEKYEEIKYVEILSLWEIEGLEKYKKEIDGTEYLYEYVPINEIEKIIGNRIIECAVHPSRLRNKEGSRQFNCKERYSIF